jgi:hypothetical protein
MTKTQTPATLQATDLAQGADVLSEHVLEVLKGVNWSAARLDMVLAAGSLAARRWPDASSPAIAGVAIPTGGSFYEVIRFPVRIPSDRTTITVGASVVLADAGQAAEVKITVDGVSATIAFAFADSTKLKTTTLTGYTPETAVIVTYEVRKTSGVVATDTLLHYYVACDVIASLSDPPVT